MKLALSSLAASLVWALVWIAAPVTVMAQGASSGDGITLYNAQHASLAKAWVDAFTRETGIKVTVRNGEDTELATRLCRKAMPHPPTCSLRRTRRQWSWSTRLNCLLQCPPIFWHKCQRISDRHPVIG